MKYKIIRINDISEIDTSKISVYDMNNRYIDTFGNMFCLKYNKGSKKIDIVKIMRAHTKDASFLQQKIIKKKIGESKADEHYTEDGHFDISNEKNSIFDPEIFIQDSMDLMETHKGRLKGIIMNIQKSNIVKKEDKNLSTELENIFRNIELDGIQSFEKAENYQRELINYPRSITYYQAKIDKKGREIIETLSGNSEKLMKFIYYYEMYHTIKTLYRSLNKMINNLDNFILDISEEETSKLIQHERQAFLDAKVSLDNTIEEVEHLLDGLNIFEEFLYEDKNY